MPSIQTVIPHHVAIIMDGNGRWAKAQGKPRVYGHTIGAQRIREIIQAAHTSGVKVLTLYAFSTENWRRPQDEVGFLMQLLVQYLRTEVTNLHENNVVLRVIGDTSAFSDEIQKEIVRSTEKTTNNTGLILNIALNYGSRSEITHAVNELLKEGKNNITEDDITRHLYTKNIPDPDLLIRTAGEKRISNFLLWQIAYAELVFVPICWPDFDAKYFLQTIEEFAARKRTFGGIIE